MRDLGTYRGRKNSYAMDINDAGVIVGHTLTLADRSRAIRWDGRRARDLGALGGGESGATAINNRGQVVGYATVPDEGSPPWTYRAILHKAGAMRDLGLPGGAFCQAFNINDAGVIVGVLITAGLFQSFVVDLRSENAAGYLDPLPGDDESYALDINDAGHIMGISQLSGRAGVRHRISRPFLYAAGTLHELRMPPDYHINEAGALNNRGQVVGSGYVGPDDNGLMNRALLWQDGTVLDLNDLGLLDQGWVLIGASDINDAGQIVVNGYREGQCRAFLLSPVVLG